MLTHQQEGCVESKPIYDLVYSQYRVHGCGGGDLFLAKL